MAKLLALAFLALSNQGLPPGGLYFILLWKVDAGHDRCMTPYEPFPGYWGRRQAHTHGVVTAAFFLEFTWTSQQPWARRCVRMWW